ncbi:MFS transporter [Enteractinococcus helveticum]|uniref:Major facilitator superfamily (MFS) profile domain-containing protein n=1 Tax=Enteractinococcus helveticum TaxID=1837282 RepID=A0A1B7M0T2_9MICC|nr:MFS transporter [Enteractinococcus helveticum]OAV61834.1 hypothetical protein A6F49_08060 [Enteractinococcus helveticum]
MINQQTSKHIAIAVNLAKLMVLAALAPPVVAGIAQRASELGQGFDVPTLVAQTVSLGSVAGVVGALGFGALADWNHPTLKSRWIWIATTTILGTSGLVILALGESRLMLIGGWMCAQLGYSGAIAVLRAVLALSTTTHRQRGAVVTVLGGYAGAFIPLVILFIFPMAIWHTTFGLALLSLAVPVVFLLITPSHIMRTPTNSTPDPAQSDDAPPPSSAIPTISRGWILAIQWAASVVIAIFLSYHALELAERASDDAAFPVRTTMLVVAAALLGLIAASIFLLRKPHLLSYSLQVIALAGFMLAASLVFRAFTDHLAVIVGAAILSGAAVGLNTSALFASALENARQRAGGRLMGAYSAAAALGQLLGPMIALGILRLTADLTWIPSDEAGYRTLFLVVAIVPAGWATVASARARVLKPTNTLGKFPLA